jgi:hypothetical protein
VALQLPANSSELFVRRKNDALGQQARHPEWLRSAESPGILLADPLRIAAPFFERKFFPPHCVCFGARKIVETDELGFALITKVPPVRRPRSDDWKWPCDEGSEQSVAGPTQAGKLSSNESPI